MSFPAFLISFVLLLPASLLGASSPIVDTLPFPAAWMGDWQGELVIYNATGVAQRIPMQLKIQKQQDTVYQWTIVYGEDELAGARNYLLKVVDQKQGFYQIDEQNTILLDSYLLGGKFFSTFEVGGTYLMSSTEMRDGKLYYEIIAGPTAEPSKTGNTGTGEEKIPEVTSYPVRVRQLAVLEAVRNEE